MAERHLENKGDGTLGKLRNIICRELRFAINLVSSALHGARTLGTGILRRYFNSKIERGGFVPLALLRLKDVLPPLEKEEACNCIL